MKSRDMLEFYPPKNRDAVKRAFPGATASQINHSVHASLSEDNPTTLVICAGTNNLTKKNQTADQTSQEIIEIAQSCHQGGVSIFFVSGITCRPKFKVKIDEINKLLKYNAGVFNYSYIDETNIRKQYLWKDDLHLNTRFGK